ncbi:MAG: carboxypeptidase-like regulatory domain-containing protein [Planctomycetota bacterium]
MRWMLGLVLIGVTVFVAWPDASLPPRAEGEYLPDTVPEGGHPAPATPRAELVRSPRTLTVSVHRPDGEPYVEALVRAVNADGIEQTRGVTDRQGEARLKTRGRIRILVTQARPFVSYRSALIDPRATAHDVRLERGTAAILGRLVDVAGRPVAGRVRAETLEGDPVGHADAASGSFRVEGLKEGRYRLRIRGRPEGEPASRPLDPVEAHTGDEEFEIAFPPCAWVRPRFRNAATGAPIHTRRWIEVVGKPRVAFTGEDRWFALEPDRDVEFGAGAEGYTSASPWSMRPSSGVHEARVDLRPDPDAWGELVLRVVYENGDPVQPAVISRFASGAWTLTERHDSDDGVYSVRLVAGRHRMGVVPTVSYEASGDRKEYTTQPFDVEMERGGRVERTITIRATGWLLRPWWGDRPISSMTIYRNGTTALMTVSFGAGPVRLRPGRYDVIAVLPQGTKLYGSVTIEAGRGHRVELGTSR